MGMIGTTRQYDIETRILQYIINDLLYKGLSINDLGKIYRKLLKHLNQETDTGISFESAVRGLINMVKDNPNAALDLYISVTYNYCQETGCYYGINSIPTEHTTTRRTLVEDIKRM